MQGKQAIVDKLNSLLTAELTAADLYAEQARMFARWGYSKLQERFAHESEDERRHADKLVQRILFLEGEPDVLSRQHVKPVRSPHEILKSNLQYELQVAKELNEAIALCVAEGDNASREVLAELLWETEADHIDWLEAQLGLIDSLGLERYLAEQIHG